MKTFLKNEWIQILILALPFIALAVLWNQLPDRVPIHWNARGQVNGYSSKTFGSLIMPCVNIFVALLIGLLPRIDPKLTKLDADARVSLWHTVKILRLAITGFESLVALAMLFVAAKVFPHGLDFNALIYVATGALLAIIGNFLTKLRPNYFIGIRTPWTLESKEVWTKTHRVGGPLMMLVGVTIVLCGLLLPPQLVVLAVLTSVLSYVVFVLLYSYLLHKKQHVDSKATHL